MGYAICHLSSSSIISGSKIIVPPKKTGEVIPDPQTVAKKAQEQDHQVREGACNKLNSF